MRGRKQAPDAWRSHLQSRSSGVARAVAARRQEGWSLVELLIVVAVIGIIASILLPNLLIAVDKAKQKRTMAEMQKVGEALTAWFLDEIAAAAAGANSSTNFNISDFGSPLTHDQVEDLLVPTYSPIVPERDQWGFPIEYYVQSSNLNGDQVIALRSPAKDGQFETGYKFGPFVTSTFYEDLVWADGRFVRWPNS